MGVDSNLLCRDGRVSNDGEQRLSFLGSVLGNRLNSSFPLRLELVVEEEESLFVVSMVRSNASAKARGRGGRARTDSGSPEMTNMRSPVSS